VETLKNVNKHLTEVFKQIAAKDSALNSVADELRRAAAKCGEIKIEAWSKSDQRFVTQSLKTHLNDLASQLEGVKS
jgi:DNA-binding FrmR family transcriptional regulator